MIVLPCACRRRDRGRDQGLASTEHQLPALRRIGGAASGVHEVRMRAISAGIEDGHFHAASAGRRRRQILAGQQAPCLQRLDGLKPPGGRVARIVGRSCHCVSQAVRLYVLNLRVAREPSRDSERHSGGNRDPEEPLAAQCLGSARQEDIRQSPYRQRPPASSERSGR